MKKLLHNAKLMVVADQLMVSGTAFVTNVLVAKVLDPSAFGMFSLIGLVQVFCLSLSMGLITQVYQVVYPSLDKNKQRLYTDGCLYWQVLLLLPFALVLLMIKNAFGIYSQTIPAAVIACSLFLIQDLTRKMLLSRQAYIKAFITDSLTGLLQLLLLVMAWRHQLLNITTAWWIIGLTYIPSLLLSLLWLMPTTDMLQALQYSWQLHKQRTGWMLMSNMLQWGTGYFFIAASGWWINPAALGALRLAQYVFGLLNVLLQAIENYALPKVAAASHNANAYLFRMLKGMLLLMLPLLLLLCLFSQQVMILMGGQAYAQYHYLIYGLSVVYVIITIGYPVRLAIRTWQLNRQYFTGYVLAMLFSVTTAYWLLHGWQLSGVLLGLLMIQLITVCYWMMILQQRKLISWKSFTLF